MDMSCEESEEERIQINVDSSAFLYIFFTTYKHLCLKTIVCDNHACNPICYWTIFFFFSDHFVTIVLTITYLCYNSTFGKLGKIDM